LALGFTGSTTRSTARRGSTGIDRASGAAVVPDLDVAELNRRLAKLPSEPDEKLQ